MSNFKTKCKNDNNFMILPIIENIINYEIENGQFILTDNEFWEKYINLSTNNLKNLLLIKQSISLCKKFDKNLNIDFKKKMFNEALTMINNEKYKDDEIIDCFKKEKKL